jgi:hypothetical protein
VPLERPENMATKRKSVEIPANSKLGTDTDQRFMGLTLQNLRFKSHWIMLYINHESINWWDLYSSSGFSWYILLENAQRYFSTKVKECAKMITFAKNWSIYNSHITFP